MAECSQGNISGPSGSALFPAFPPSLRLGTVSPSQAFALLQGPIHRRLQGVLID